LSGDDLRPNEEKYMSNGSNISATTWLNNLDVVAWGPLNPGWGSGNYEAKQTALWLTSGPGVIYQDVVPGGAARLMGGA
jgi:hypothetical protein